MRLAVLLAFIAVALPAIAAAAGPAGRNGRILFAGDYAHTRVRPSIAAVDVAGRRRTTIVAPRLDVTNLGSPLFSPAGDRIAFVRRGELWVAAPDGSGARRLTRLRPVVGGPVWSPDGARIAFVLQEGAREIWQLRTVAVSGGAPRRLVRTRDVLGRPAWAPGGREIAVAVRGALDVYPTGGGRPHRVRLQGAASEPAFAPDGRLAVTLSRGSRQSVALVGRGNGAIPFASRGRAPSWSPDGSRIAFVSRSAVFVGDPATMRAQVVWRRRVLQRPPLWTSDGRTLVVAAGGDLYRVSTAGGARRITRERPRRGVLGPPTVSPRGRVAFSTVPLEPSQLDLYTVRPDGADIRRLTSTPVDELLPKLSTDRRQIAFVRAGGIYTMPAGGGPARRVAAGESYDWGPDGRMVVARGGRLRIGDRILPTGEGRAELPSWSPDGRMIVFARGVDLYAVAPDGTGLRRVTDEAAKDEKPCGLVHSATAPAFSPDGSRIAFVELEASATACGSHGGFGYPAVMDADGSDARVIDHALLVSPYDSGVATIAWAPDGTQVVFDMEYDIAPSGSGPIAIEPVAGGGARFLLRRAGSAETPFWLPAP